jgi:bifunctional enzyme CysN/CysC
MKKKYNPNIELLKIVIIGSVDDGKSTLLGRLFYDLDEIYEDQLESLKKLSVKQGKKEIDLSLFTDGLSEEREQKITIDVAYRYFSNSKRRFILADVPGHEQYTKNMVTGCSNADLAIILSDAEKGLLKQSKRHLSIASLMGVSHILVAVNKMDLVNYNQDIFEKIKEDFADFATKLDIHDLQFIPVSSLKGDMIVNRKENMNWYQGPTINSYIENLEITIDKNLFDFRFPVQLVIRPNQKFRGYAGQIEGGTIKKGEMVRILPSGEKTKIKSIIVGREEKDYAFNPQAVVLELEDELDVSRGDMILRENNLAKVSKNLEATICWMSNKPLKENKSYILKQTTKTTRCFINKIFYRINIDTLHREKTNELKLNDIGRIGITANQLLMFDPYTKNENTGSFIIIDEITNNTVGAGVILKATEEKKQKIEEGKGFVLWFTGFSQSGKTTIADKVYKELKKRGVLLERLDGDIVRESLTKDLDFSKEGRDENIKRVGFISKLLSRNGVGVIATFISPYREARDKLRGEVNNFIEVFCNASLETCEERDTKGLYKKARIGKIKNFTGISDPYEAPKNPEIELKTDEESIEECVSKIIEYLEDKII